MKILRFFQFLLPIILLWAGMAIAQRRPSGGGGGGIRFPTESEERGAGGGRGNGRGNRPPNRGQQVNGLHQGRYPGGFYGGTNWWRDITSNINFISTILEKKSIVSWQNNKKIVIKLFN